MDIIGSLGGFLHGSDSKEPACNLGDPGSIPWWGNNLEKEMATHSNILVWEILWTEEPGGSSPWSHKKLETIEANKQRYSKLYQLYIYIHIYI